MSIFLFEAIFFIGLLDHGNIVQVQEEKIYTVSEVNVKPEPVKGMNDFHDKWSKGVVYPEDAIREKIQGMVFIQFVVNIDGTIADASVKSGIGYGCDEAALKGFKNVSKEIWKPGFKNDQNVKVKMVLPFAFRIIERK